MRGKDKAGLDKNEGVPIENPDEFTRLVIQEFRRAAAARDDYTVPWLDLDVEAHRAFL